MARLQLVRARLDHENELLSQRTTWVVATQAFLFSAYALCLVGAGRQVEGPHAAAIEVLLKLLPWAAIISLALLYVTLAGGLLAMARLRRAMKPSEPLDRLVLEGGFVSRAAGLTAPMLIPAVFVVLWATVLVRR
jgi:hypothetical protein